MKLRKPEIMSPAGYWPQLHAAIEAGADAVYFGLNHFTARAKVGFTLEELPDVMRTLHQRGVRGYVTFNTLVFDHELDEAVSTIETIAKAGVDSVIVQDVGVVQLVTQIAPDMEVHGSTQMSITSAEGVALAQQFGASRVVLARELSLKDIGLIREQLVRDRIDCELEMFVHGALCVSYSGQCFSSEAWGGRSANRGQCAQACRLPYDMIVDGEHLPLNDLRYLLSPGDLYALRQMPEVVALGISSLKIEGRYKDANYVALTTQAYRQGVDMAWDAYQKQKQSDKKQSDKEQADTELAVDGVQEYQLEQVYSRGLGPHFVSGIDHQAVVQGRSPRHRGVLMGKVVQVQGSQIIVKPESTPVTSIAPLKAGDGVVFDAAHRRSIEEDEQGGRIYHVTPLTYGKHKGKLALEFGNHVVDFHQVRKGDWVWRTHDPEVEKVARPWTQANSPVAKQSISTQILAHEGKPLRIKWRLDKQPNRRVVTVSDEPLGTARNRGIDPAFARKQLGRLGNTAYELNEVQLNVTGDPFVPSSVLNNLRRQAVEQLMALQSEVAIDTVGDGQALLAQALSTTAAYHPPAEQICQLHILVRTPEQLEAALTLEDPPASITLDYLDLYGLRPAVEQIQAKGIRARVASPRVLKPNEQRIVNFLLRLKCDIVVRSGGLLHALQAHDTPTLIGDFSLNAANVLSADTFLQLGIERLTPTHDLNADQVTLLASNLGPDKLEVIAYQHLPVFHTEHCVFCRFLSTGTSYKNCGKPCESHRVGLRDVQGRTHPVMADVGCRNTVFGAEAQEASEHLAQWMAAGIQDYRLEFVHEDADEVTQVAQAFRQALDGTLTPRQLSQQLRQIAPQGTTEGSLFVPDDYMAVPVL
ncbi:MAG: DUF3656 domain-containing protein [Chloroflexota bacterium]